ncbi:sororin [Archocentrus centrarchus]|uniref:sororin n=1 Tax=Archocentrus centrarchus TaxID=63155 RepID=UPI0011E9C291|nr:sororin [Archocentrus centrarchus]
MNEGTSRSIMTESNSFDSSQRRRSPRLSSPPQAQSDNKMALPSVAVKRSITVRKIAPRKTVALLEQNKENTPRPSGSEGIQQKKLKVSTPGPVPDREGSSSSAKKEKKAAMPSPILPSSPSPASRPPQLDPDDDVWSQKVRRSYSRLSEKSLNGTDSCETLFGFEKLKTPEVVVRRPGLSKSGLEVSAGSFTGLNSFTSLLEADDYCGSAFPEPDPNIPGVAVVKEKRRRKKIQQIDTTELDALAAKMNAEFEEAEEFELVVE